MNECYICTDSTPPLLHDVCACKNRHVHPECQKRLIVTLERSARCAVCKTQYKNAVIAVDRRLNWQFVLIVTVNICSVWLSFMGIAFFLFRLRNEQDALSQMCVNRTMSQAFDFFIETTPALRNLTCTDFLLVGDIRLKFDIVLCAFSFLVTLAFFVVTRYNKRHFPRFIETRRVHVDASYDCCTRSLDSASPDEGCTQTLETPRKEPSSCGDTPGFV